MQIRVKNLNKGGRGIYVDGNLVEIGGGETSTFTGASAAERDAAAEVEGLKVQSRQSESVDWTDHFKEEMPEERPWIAYAIDAKGTDFVPVGTNAWYVGHAVASERPDSAAGYKWVKVGSVDGGMEASSSEKSEAAPVEPEDDKKSLPDNTNFTAEELVKHNGAAVIEAVKQMDADRAAQVGDAEEKREGGPRKGVMKAVEEAIAAD